MNKLLLTSLLATTCMASAYANCSQYTNPNQNAICRNMENSANQAQQNFLNNFNQDIQNNFKSLAPTNQQWIYQKSLPSQYQPQTAPQVQQPQIKPLQPQQPVSQPRVRYY